MSKKLETNIETDLRAKAEKELSEEVVAELRQKDPKNASAIIRGLKSGSLTLNNKEKDETND